MTSIDQPRLRVV